MSSTVVQSPAYPPGPREPQALFLAKWLRDPLGFLEAAYARFGPVFTLRMPGAPLVLVSGGEANRIFFAHRALALPGEQELNLLLGDRGVLLLSGAEHKERRRVLMPWFKGSVLDDWAVSIARMTRDCMTGLTERAAGAPVNVRDFMQEITLNVMLQITFGSHEGARRQGLREAVSERMLSSAAPAAVLGLWLPLLRGSWWPAWRRTQEAQADCDRAFFAEIAEARAAGGTDLTLLNILINATTEDGAPLPDVDVRDELMTLMVAGHENTASALSWAIYWVNRDPATLARLWEEIAGLGPDPDPGAIARLPYLDAICQETLRLYPPVMMTLMRVAQEPILIGDHLIPEGAVIRSSIHLTHRDPAVYPDPHSFRPERFLGDPGLDGSTFMPFGGGGRRCLGSHFAIFEMKIILAEIVRGWSVTLPAAAPKPVRRTGLLAPDTRFAVRIAPREAAPCPA